MNINDIGTPRMIGNGRWEIEWFDGQPHRTETTVAELVDRIKFDRDEIEPDELADIFDILRRSESCD